MPPYIRMKEDSAKTFEHAHTSCKETEEGKKTTLLLSLSRIQWAKHTSLLWVNIFESLETIYRAHTEKLIFTLRNICALGRQQGVGRRNNFGIRQTQVCIWNLSVTCYVNPESFPESQKPQRPHLQNGGKIFTCQCSYKDYTRWWAQAICLQCL